MENVVVYASTAMFKGADAIKTKLTIDMSDLTEQDLIEYAVDSLKIKWQSSIRRKKDSVIPAEATYKAPRAGTRSAPQMLPMDALVMVCGGNKELAIALSNKAGGADKALAMFQNIAADMEADG